MHWFLNPITNHYADFTGRASREQFWMFQLCVVLLSIALEMLEAIDQLFFALGFAVSLGLMLPSLAIGTRRLHDIGKSGWWQLLWFVPIIGWILLIVWFIQKSDAGPNVYGAPVGSADATTPETGLPSENVQSEVLSEPDNRTLREQAEDHR